MRRIPRNLGALAACGLLALLGACTSDDEASPASGIGASTSGSDAATAGTAWFHAIPADSQAVTGTASCAFSQEGVDPTGGDSKDLVTCQLDMSDPRVTGTEIHDRFRYYDTEGDEAGLWVEEEAIITNREGTWRGFAQAVDDGTPMGEARYVGEGAYDGLVFHYYFGELGVGEATVHGWISSGE